MVNKGFNDNGGRSGIVGDLLMRDPDSVKVIQSLSRFTEGKLEVHMHGEAQGHDMSVMFGKLQGGGILRQGV